MSDVMSTWVRRHPTHMLDGFGDMATPHWQHNLEKKIIAFLSKLVTYVVGLLLTYLCELI